MKRILAVAALVGGATPALAHVGLHEGFSPAAGFVHPFQGADHLAAMIIVGMLAVAGGGARRWVWPLAFIGGMIAGALGVGLVGSGGVVETGVVLTLVAAAVAFVVPVAMSVRVGALAVGVAGLLHGMAHGAEAPAGDFAGYVAGFVVATALLHAVGVVTAQVMARGMGTMPVRVAGVAAALVGVAVSMS